MFRPQVILWIAFLAGTVTSLAVAAPMMHQGRVTGVSKGELMVTTTPNVEAVTFKVDDSTKITLDNKPASLVNLQPGFIVDITAVQATDGTRTAKMIVAFSKLSPRHLATRTRGE